MPPPYCYKYPRPAVTVDLAAFGLEGDRLRVLLIRRGRDPFAGRWALPGGFLDLDEPPEVGALRELREETGLDLAGPLFPVGFFAEPGRDPRGRTISLAFGATVASPLPVVSGDDDAAEAAWMPTDRLEGGFAFDHEEIVGRALARLREVTLNDGAARALLPDPFGKSDVRRMFHALDLPDGGAERWLRRFLASGQIRREGGHPVRYRATASGNSGAS